jgi:hypothetical protein
VLKTDARVRRRHERSLGWEEIGGDEKLFRSDIVYTPNETSAYIEFGDQRRIQLEPGSMIQLDDVSKEQLQITLFSGKVKGDVQIKSKPAFRLAPYPKVSTKKRDLLPDPQALELLFSEWDSRVRQWLDHHPRRESLRSISAVSTQLDRISDYEITLVHPAEKTYNLGANRWLEMQWKGPPLKGEVEYQLDVAKDPRFSAVLSYKTKRNQLSVQFDDPGTYYWRVRVTRGREFNFSKVAQFSMSRTGGQGKASGLGLPDTGPQGFTAEVSRSPSFHSIALSQVVDNPRCPQSGLRPGKYFCRLTSILGGKPKTYSFIVK